MKKQKTKAKQAKKTKPKAKSVLKPMTRERAVAQAKAAIDEALTPAAGGRRKKGLAFPGAEELADAVWNLSRVVNKNVQKIYDQVLSQTIIKLQHARRKNIV